MKRLMVGVLLAFFLCSGAYGGTRTTVTKDSAGTMSRVSAYVTDSGITVWEVQSDGSVSMYASEYNNSGVITAPNGHIAVFNPNSVVSGYPEISGASITAGTLVIDNSDLPDPITNEISTTDTITGRSKHINLSSGSLETLYMSSVSSIWVSAVSNSARSPTAGVSCQLTSPTASGYDAVFIMENSTTDKGTTAYILFTQNDVIACNQTIIAGVSKFIMSGNTGSQKIICHSTGQSKWYVDTSGGPTIDWD